MPFDRLIDNIKAKTTLLWRGLDPKLSYLPAYLKENAYRITEKLWREPPRLFWSTIRA